MWRIFLRNENDDVSNYLDTEGIKIVNFHERLDFGY